MLSYQFMKFKMAFSKFFSPLGLFARIHKRAVLLTSAVILIAAVIVPVMIWRAGRLTREHFIYDFNYMLTILEENFPSFGMIYFRNGVDMHVVGEELRERLENGSNSIDFEYFWTMLRDEYFVHAWPVGGLRLLGEQERRSLFWETTQWHNNWQHSLEVLGRPQRHREYVVLQSNSALIQLPPAPDRTISMYTIDDGRIAYLRLHRSWGDIDSFSLSLSLFYEYIADYEHLIIDLRESGDISNDVYLIYRVFSPLINRTMGTYFHHFYYSGEYNVAHFDRVTNHHISLLSENVNNIFAHRNVPDFTPDEFGIFDYRFVEFFIIRPAPIRQRSPFTGEIWVLIDRYIYAGKQHSVALFKDAGIATFVGETTGGMVGTTRSQSSNLITLPNTGIIVIFNPAFITTQEGHPLELGTDPHYFNRPGMDALETVLAMIAEGAY